MEYNLKDNRIILVRSNTDIQVLWFKDLKKFTLSGTVLYFAMTFGNATANSLDITAYNGWGVAPPVATIYNDTITAIAAFDGNTSSTINLTASNVSGNYAFPVDPTVINDTAHCYSIFDTWLNTVTKDAFICVDNTTNAAVWKKFEYVNL